jgi:hypothetical protein
LALLPATQALFAWGMPIYHHLDKAPKWRR